MIEQPQELQVFSILDKEKISKIMDILDESIVRDQFKSPKIKKLEELGFTNQQSRDILECFFNFYHGLVYPDLMMELINNIDFKDDVKKLVIETFEVIRKKGDKTKVIMADKAEQLEDFGHDHLHGFKAISEFRPIIENGELRKLITSIIVEGNVQNANHTKTTSINFQTNLENFEMLVQDLNEELKRVKTEVAALKEKLGEDIVD